MKVPYEVLTDEAKVLIYPGSRKFFPKELPEIREKADKFIESIEGIDLFFELFFRKEDIDDVTPRLAHFLTIRTWHVFGLILQHFLRFM